MVGVYSRRMNYQKGFISPLLLALVALLLVGGGAYVYMQRGQTNQQTLIPPTQTAPQAKAISISSHDIINSVYIKDDTEFLFTDDAGKTWTVNYQNATGGIMARNGDKESLQDWLKAQKHVGDAPIDYGINDLPPGFISIIGTIDVGGILDASTIEILAG